MDQLSGILLHMDLMDPHKLLSLLRLDLYLTVSADGQIQLGNLIVLRVIGIKIILTIEFTILRDVAVGGKTYRYRVFQHLLV